MRNETLLENEIELFARVYVCVIELRGTCWFEPFRSAQLLIQLASAGNGEIEFYANIIVRFVQVRLFFWGNYDRPLSLHHNFYPLADGNKSIK